MSSFTLKIMACVAMLFDHLGYFLYGKISWMNFIGRISFPIFAFLIAEGYIHTKNLKKYFLRLFVFALISQLPFMLFLSTISNDLSFNIMFTLCLGLISIYIFDKYGKITGILAACVLGLLAQLFNFDYGLYGVIIIFVFYVFRNNISYLMISFCIVSGLKYIIPLIKIIFDYNLATFFKYFPQYIYLMIFTMCAIIPICFYNKKQGKKIKYFFYLFYPVHLSLLYFLTLLRA